MQLTLENTDNPNAIQTFEPGLIKINHADYSTDIIITPSEITVWQSQPLDEINLLNLMDYKPDLIILGTGQTLQYLDNKLRFLVQKEGIGLEVMATQAACRTFNILLAENRNVLAALQINY